MESKIVLTVCIIMGLIILLLVFRLIRILRNPSKYEVIPGYLEYRRSKYYWPINLEYTKASSVDVGFTSPMLLVFPAVFLWHKFIIAFHLLGAPDGISFNLLGQSISFFSVCLLMITAYVLSSYLALFSRLPKDIQYTLFNMGKGEKRSVVWKRWTATLLLIVLVFFPTQVAILMNGGYVNETELVYISGFQFEKHEFIFSEISEIEVISDESTGEIMHYYLINGLGERFDLCDEKIVLESGGDFVLWEYVDSILTNEFDP